MGDYLYPVLLSIAALVGTWICETRSADPPLARMTCLAGIFAGVLGARIWFWAQYGSLPASGGMSFYGFGLGALAGVLLFHRWYHSSWASTDFPDAAAPAYALGTALFRIGCYQAGCCFGRVCDLPWAIRYEAGSNAYSKQLADGMINPAATETLPIHPTQLYDVAAGLLAFFALIWISRALGNRFLRYELWLGLVLSYCVYRFFLEFLRGDAGGVSWGTLTFAQLTSIGVFVPFFYVLVSRRVRFHGGAHLPLLREGGPTCD